MAAALVVGHQIITVHIEHDRLIRHALKDEFGIDLIEYCLMDSLLCYGCPLPSSFLRQFNTQKYRTMLCVVTSLEDKGIVSKEQTNGDRKAFLIRLTMHGEQLARRASQMILDLMKSTFWKNIPENEIIDMMRYSTTTLSNLKAAPLQLYGMNHQSMKIHPYFFLDIVYLIRRWKEVAMHSANLSLTEFRILSLIGDNEKMSSSEIASTLCIEKSSVSAGKAILLKKKLIYEIEDEADRRRSYLFCTNKGKRVAEKLNKAVERETIQYFSPIDEEIVNLLNAQHMRMYCEIRRFHNRKAANEYTDSTGSS